MATPRATSAPTTSILPAELWLHDFDLAPFVRHVLHPLFPRREIPLRLHHSNSFLPASVLCRPGNGARTRIVDCPLCAACEVPGAPLRGRTFRPRSPHADFVFPVAAPTAGQGVFCGHRLAPFDQRGP